MTTPKVNRSLGIRKANPAANAIVAAPATIEIVDNASAELVNE